MSGNSTKTSIDKGMKQIQKCMPFIKVVEGWQGGLSTNKIGSRTRRFP